MKLNHTNLTKLWVIFPLTLKIKHFRGYCLLVVSQLARHANDRSLEPINKLFYPSLTPLVCIIRRLGQNRSHPAHLMCIISPTEGP